MAILGIAGLLLTPIYLAMAAVAGAPGLGFRMKCFWLGIRLMLNRRAPMDMKTRLLLASISMLSGKASRDVI
jgi:hypothetical protein